VQEVELYAMLGCPAAEGVQAASSFASLLFSPAASTFKLPFLNVRF